MSDISCQQREFGATPEGRKITQFILRNASGLSVSLINYGASITSVQVPDSRGKMNELTLGFDSLEDYLTHPFYFGATIGRVTNRITGGKYTYQGKHYQLNPTFENSTLHLHGGKTGFDKAVWDAEVFKSRDAAGVEFTLISPDGDQGYPGNLTVKAIYSLNLANELKLIYQAHTDQTTPVNLTNHTYWNLAGAGSGTILEHIFQVWADKYTVLDKDLLPTGEIKDVKCTPFDFTKPQRIGERMEEIEGVGGYDLCYVLNPVSSGKPSLVARMKEPLSGRILEVSTTQPGLQFYTSNSLKYYPISNGQFTDKYGAFCLETQNLADAVNHSNFPSPFLMPGDTYLQETVYKLIW